MIFVTGDTHGLRDISKFNSTYFRTVIDRPENILIITGDFGAIWSNKTMFESLKFYSELKVGKILFIDGNNENFDLLDKYPVTMWNGGKVQQITSKIIHLMRGQVYEIEGKKIFTLGGANSYDAPRPGRFTSRVEHESWWKEEGVTKEQFYESLRNLAKHNFKVDVIITHDSKLSIVQQFFAYSLYGQTGETNGYLQQIDSVVDYKKWFFGHHHADLECSPTDMCVFKGFIDITDLSHLPTRNELLGVTQEELPPSTKDTTDSKAESQNTATEDVSTTPKNMDTPIEPIESPKSDDFNLPE